MVEGAGGAGGRGLPGRWAWGVGRWVCAGLDLTADLTALTLARDLLEGRRVSCRDEARRDGTLDRERRLAERVQLLVHALAQDSPLLLVQAVVDART